MNKLFACLFLLMCMLTINSSIIENPLPANMKENDLQGINRVLVSGVTAAPVPAGPPTVLNLKCLVTDTNGGCTAWETMWPAGILNICVANILDIVCVIQIV